MPGACPAISHPQSPLQSREPRPPLPRRILLHRQRPVLSHLQAVCDRAGNDAWAVGYYRGNGPAQTLIEHWNGINWQVIPSPNVGTSDNYLNAVTAREADDAWAVGYYRNGTVSQTLIMHWN